MRAVLVLLGLALAVSAHAEAPQPLVKLTPPAGTFFDDPVALSADGKLVAAIATDAAAQATLELFDVTKKDAVPVQLAGVTTTATHLEWLAPDRLLLVDRQLGGKLEAALLSFKGGRLVADKKKLGPADAIEGVTLAGKRVVALYERRAGKKSGAEHVVTIVGADGHVMSKTHFAEDAEGGLRTRAGLVRMLWWYDGYTRLAAQRVGEYDKGKDIRRPDRLVHLDTTADKVLDEHEIEDLMQFTRMTAAHRQHPGEDPFVRYADDHRQLVIDAGLTETPLPLARALATYEPASLTSAALSDQRLLVALQVDPNNADAIARRVPDQDDVDLYELDLTKLPATVSMPRVKVLPGLGRPARVTAVEKYALVLRKDRGFDRGGVALELYTLP